MKHYILVLLIITSFASAWERTYDFVRGESFCDVVQISDGGFILAGFSGTSTTNRSNILTMRVDEDGNQIWHNLYGEDDLRDYANDILLIDDTTFIVTGVSRSAFPEVYGNYLYLAKMTTDGATLWTTVCDTLFYIQAIDIAEDGNLIVLDGSWPALAKYTMDGVGVWSKRFYHYPYSFITFLYDMKACRQEPYGYITAGYGSIVDDDYDAVLARFNLEGDTTWVRHYDTGEDECFYAVSKITNPAPGFPMGYLAVGCSGGCGGVYYAVRTDLTGDTLWTRTYSHPLEDGEQRAVDVIWAGNEPYQTKFAMVGYTAFPESLSTLGVATYATWMLVVSDTLRGDTLWTRTFSNHNKEQIPYAITLCDDNGFAIVGNAEDSLLLPAPHLINDCWMVRIDSLGNDLPSAIAENSAKPAAFEITAYPNPFNGNCRIMIDDLGMGIDGIEIYDINGRMVDVVARRASPDEAISRTAETDCRSLRPRNDGVSEFIWQPDDALGSGVYLVRARIPGNKGQQPLVQSKRVVYLK